MNVGFTGGDSKLDPYSEYIGKPGIYGVGPIDTMGLLEKIEDGFLVVRPSIVGTGDGMRRIERDTPTKIEIVPGQQRWARPLREGDMENNVAHRNRETIRENYEAEVKFHRMFGQDPNWEDCYLNFLNS